MHDRGQLPSSPPASPPGTFCSGDGPLSPHLRSQPSEVFSPPFCTHSFYYGRKFRGLAHTHEALSTRRPVSPAKLPPLFKGGTRRGRSARDSWPCQPLLTPSSRHHASPGCKFTTLADVSLLQTCMVPQATPPVTPHQEADICFRKTPGLTGSRDEAPRGWKCYPETRSSPLFSIREDCPLPSESLRV